MCGTFDRRGLLQTLAIAGAATAVAAVGRPSHAQSLTPRGANDLGRWFAEAATRHRIPGIAAVVARRDRPPLVLTHGYASLPFRAPVHERTLFHLASTSKHLTAAAVLRLVAARRLALDTPLEAHLKSLPADWGRATIHQLLTHTAGLPDYEDRIIYDRPYTREQFLEVASAHPRDFVPGAAWSYSNTGYVLMGWLIEAVTGRTYSDVVQRDLLAEAGLADSRVDDAEAIIADRAEPYVPTGDGFRHALRMNGAIAGWSDGGVLMSARDVAPWHRFLDGDALLPKKLRQAMTTPVTLLSGRTFPYGYGWSTDVLAGGEAFHWHAGNVPGFTSYFCRLPADGTAVMVMTNIEGRSAVQRWIGMALAERVVANSTPLSLPPLRDSDKPLTAAARRMLFRGTERLAPEAYAAELKSLIQGRLGERAIPNLSRDSREPRAFELVQDFETSSERQRRYRLIYDDHIVHVLVGYAPDDRPYFVRFV